MKSLVANGDSLRLGEGGCYNNGCKISSNVTVIRRASWRIRPRVDLYFRLQSSSVQ